MEFFIGIALIDGSYMKATIMLFILKETLSRVLNLKDERIIIFPVTIISLLLTLAMFKTEIEFVESVFVIEPLALAIVGVLPLLFVTIFTFFRGDQTETNDVT